MIGLGGISVNKGFFSHSLCSLFFFNISKYTILHKCKWYIIKTRKFHEESLVTYHRNIQSSIGISFVFQMESEKLEQNNKWPHLMKKRVKHELLNNNVSLLLKIFIYWNLGKNEIICWHFNDKKKILHLKKCIILINFKYS